MKLPQHEIELFYKLWYSLIWSINQKHKIVPCFDKPEYGDDVNEEPFIVIREKLWENPQWIDEYLHENENDRLPQAEREILLDWRNNHVKGRFFIIKHLAKYSVFTPGDDSKKLYGVHGISNPINETVRYEIPFIAETVLLPFKGKIIYDSFISTFGVSLGKNIRDELNRYFKTVKEEIGIIESIGKPPASVKPPTKKPKPQKDATDAVEAKTSKITRSMSAR